MPKSKPSQPIIQSNARRMLALNNAGVNELAIYIGSTNWFAEELIRLGLIPHTVTGDRKVVDSRDVDVWLTVFKTTEPVRQWLRENPDKTKIPTPFAGVFVNEEEAKIFWEHLHRKDFEELKAKVWPHHQASNEDGEE